MKYFNIKKYITKKKIIILCIITVLLILYYFCLPRNLFDHPYSTVVESSDGDLLGARIATDGQWRFQMIDTVPYKFRQAIIAYEDKRFNYHIGIDPIAIGRAVKQNIGNKKIVSGGSTISMQVIRLSRGKNKRTFFEKIIEAILATRLELRHSKEDILRLYASNAPFGGNVVGLEAASWRYFGRPADNLSWAESATLAVLPNSPSLIHISRNRDQLQEKRNRLIDKLYQTGSINVLEAELAKEEDLPDKPFPLPMFVYHLTSRISNEKGQIVAKTTLDYYLQQRVNALADQKNSQYSLNKIENIAILVAEVQTGNILAYMGNAYKNTNFKNGSSVDIITAPRSSGSVFKPLLYAGMLDAGEILPNTLIADIPFHYQSFSPQNYNRTFDGAVPAHRVLERSLNVPSVRMLQAYGVERFYYLLRKLGFTTINRSPDNYGLTLVLGGAECTLWDLVSVYTGMAQKMNSLEDSSQKISSLNFYQNHTAKRYHPIDYPFDYGSIWLTFESLSNLNRPEEESEWRSFISSRKVAWKTGTSYGNRDAWSIGVTPKYVVGVWVGNADGEGRPGLTGIEYAAPVMFDAFSLLPETGWFSMPEIDMKQAVICRKSGHIATPICETTDTLWIPTEGSETIPCPYHVEINTGLDGKYRVNSNCESVSNMQRHAYFVLPPAQEWFYKTKNRDYRPLPPISPKCVEIIGQNPMEIIYPQDNFTVIITRKLDSGKNNIVFQAAHRNSQSLIFWHIDDQYIGSTQYEHKIPVNPPQGSHVLTIVDSEGFSLQTRFNVE